jgi:predicted dehydrogenase
MNRREFLKSTAAVGSAAFGVGSAASAMSLNAHVAGAADAKPLRVGLIGAGWYGKCDLFRLIQVAPVEVVSVCDVDKRQLAEAAELIAGRQKSKKTPRTYADYREMLKEKDLDVAIVGTPDHWHALPMIAAVEAGADVYVQKPVSVDVREGEAMLAAARKHKRVVQVGTQRRSTPHLIEAKRDIIEAGRLGTVGLVEICCYYHMRADLRAPVSAPPDFFDYETWAGPAPKRPYDAPPGPNGGPALPHRRWWRAFNEYSNGIVGDMAIHMLDAVRWMLNLGWPTSVSSDGGILIQKESKANITDTQSATFDFQGLPVVWTHRTWGTTPDPKYPWALTIHGDKGTLKASVMSYDFIPQGKGEAVHKDVVYELEQYPEDKTEKDLEKHVAPAIRGHMRNFVECIGTRGKPVADIEQGYISTASCIMANLSQRLGGRTLAWDPAKADVVNDPEASKLLKRPYRGPWVHPAGA